MTIAYDFDKYWEENDMGCWIWMRKDTPIASGTGEIITPRRFAYERKYGEVEEGYMVKNKCGDTRCMNPEHSYMI